MSELRYIRDGWIKPLGFFVDFEIYFNFLLPEKKIVKQGM